MTSTTHNDTVAPPMFTAADALALLEEHLTEVGKHVILETRAGDEVKVRTEVDESTFTDLVFFAIHSSSDADLGRFRITVEQVTE